LDQVKEAQQKLIAEIVRRRRVRIRPDNPMFVALALNELAQETFVQRLELILKEASHHVSALNNRQREAARILAEQTIAGGAEHIAKTTVTALEEFLATARETMANELAAILRAGEDEGKERRTAVWMSGFATGVIAMLVGTLAVFWSRGG
jgi:hypothetical protein